MSQCCFNIIRVLTKVLTQNLKALVPRGDSDVACLICITDMHMRLSIRTSHLSKLAALKVHSGWVIWCFGGAGWRRGAESTGGRCRNWGFLYPECSNNRKKEGGQKLLENNKGVPMHCVKMGTRWRARLGGPKRKVLLL